MSKHKTKEVDVWYPADTEPKPQFGDTALGERLGYAAIIIAICLGFGGCECLTHLAIH